MPHNRGTRRKPNFVGNACYKGRRKWISGCESVAAYNQAHAKALAELREEIENPNVKAVPTCSEFAGARIEPDGRIKMTWPDGQRARKREGRRDKTVRWMREMLVPFLHEFGERALDSFTRDEALSWILPKGAGTQEVVRQFFNHALDRELIPRNHFTNLGISKQKRRIERPDFEIVTDEQYERILHCARACRFDDYALVIEGIVLCAGEAAIRPSEIFALHKDEVDLDQDVIDVRWQIDSRTRKRVPVKDDDPRRVVPSPRLRAHLEMILPEPRTILFPAVRGGYMSLSNWYVHWNAVRAAAGMPKLEFYELKHRALQWMVDPIDDGGLGLDHATAAEMAGHEDGGWLIANVYTKLAERRAHERARRAMRDYAERHPDQERPAAAARPRRATGQDARRAGATVTISSVPREQPPVTGWRAGGTLSRREYAGLPVGVRVSSTVRAS
jgi:integrase